MMRGTPAARYSRGPGRRLGHHLGVMWLKRGRPDRRATVMDTEFRLAALVVAVDEAARGGREARERLVEVLSDVESAGDDDLARTALAVTAKAPKVVTGLDWHVRQAAWHSTHHSLTLRRLAARLESGSAGPIAVAVASMHRDGRVRERAVTAMQERPAAELMPFLALRTADWVGPVRDRARATLALSLAGEPDGCLPAALPAILAVESRTRTGFARSQALAALLAASVELRRSLFAAADRRMRRFVFDVGLGQEWWSLAELVTAAESDDDVWIRVRAAEAACRHAVWTRRHDLLHRLARSRRAEVRASAVTGLMRAGLDGEAAGFLDDGSPLVRAIARDAARRHGVDVIGHYRAAVTDAGQGGPGSIGGLAETGSANDAALLRPLLAHPSATIRFHVVRALRQLDAVEVDAVMPRLHDPSPAVVREATAALLPLQRRLPPALPWQLMADPRRELRRAGYRLLGPQATAVRLRAALILAVDPDPRLARRGRADATRLARDATRPRWRRTAMPELTVTTTAEHADLTTLMGRAAPALGEDTTRLLTAWLASTAPSGDAPR